MLDTTNLLAARLGVALLRRDEKPKRKNFAEMLFSLLAAPLHDEDIRPLVVAGLVSAGRLAPGGNRVTAARGLAFTTTMRVVDRVHRDTAVGGANTLPAVASGLTDGLIFVFGVAYLADGRHAVDEHFAGFAGGQLEQRVIAFLGNELNLGACGASHLRALAGTKLNVVNRGTGRNVLQRQSIADEDVGVRATHDRLANRETDRLDDVALLAVSVVNQSNAGAAVRVVLNRRHRAGDTVLITLEVDEAQLLLVTAAVMTDGERASAVAAAGALLNSEQRLMRLVRRDVVVDETRRKAE